MNAPATTLHFLFLSVALLPGAEAFVPKSVGRPAPISATTSTNLKLSPQELTTMLPTDLPEASAMLSTMAQNLPTALEEVGLEAEQLPAIAGAGAAASTLPYLTKVAKSVRAEGQRTDEPTFPEAQAATYELSDHVIPFEFGDAGFVRPLLKQTQLEYRKLSVAFDANKDGYDARIFHQKVDGKGAAVVLAKANGQWFGGYNPRGWASLGGSRPSRASFLFYKTALGWQKLRALGGGGMSCGNDLFDRGIYMGAEGLIIPLDGANRRSVASRLGTYFETGPGNRRTLLPRAAEDFRLQELKVVVGVYDKGEDIPNSGGVLDLGLY